MVASKQKSFKKVFCPLRKYKKKMTSNRFTPEIYLESLNQFLLLKQKHQIFQKARMDERRKSDSKRKRRPAVCVRSERSIQN